MATKTKTPKAPKPPPEPTLDPVKVQATVAAISQDELPLTVRPSALPKLARCVHWRPLERETEAAQAGTARHMAFAAAVHMARARKNDDQNAAEGYAAELETLMAPLSADERDGVEWAAGYVTAHATTAEPLLTEHRMELFDANFDAVTRGTADTVCGPDLFDLKWFEAQYDMQLAAYALMRMQETGRKWLDVHILFAFDQTARKTRVTWDSANRLVFGLIDRAKAGTGPRKSGSGCQYCARALTCPAFTEPVEVIRTAREDWQLGNYHSSDLADPAEMAKALTLARKVQDWCKAVEYHAKQMAGSGLDLPGFRRRTVTGRKWVCDVMGAFSVAGLPQETFLACCDVRMETPKKYPNKRGIADEYAKLHGIKKAPAKRKLDEALAPFIRRGADSVSLVSVSEPEPESSTEEVTP